MWPNPKFPADLVQWTLHFEVWCFLEGDTDSHFRANDEVLIRNQRLFEAWQLLEEVWYTI